MNEIATMKGLPEEERPYEKCQKNGPKVLSDTELLAVILRTGTTGKTALELAQDILYNEGRERGVLNIHQWTFQELIRMKGVGKVKAIQILCISELAKRLSKAKVAPTLSFNNPASIAEFYMEEMRHEKQEVVKLLLLNTKSKFLGTIDISKGTVNGSALSPREIFIEALQMGAVNIVLLHNHPSGDPTPSKEDILLTKRVKCAGEMIGIDLVDHIIIGNHSYTSFAEKNII